MLREFININHELVNSHNNHKTAKILVLIPIIVFAASAVCMGPLMISYFSTGSDVTAVALIFIGTVILILTTLPCLVMAIVGTVFAAKAKKEEQQASRKFFIIGIVEIVIYGGGVICAIIAALITILAAGR